MTFPDPYAAVRLALIGEPSVATLLLPQTSLPGLATPPVFALEYPRKTTEQPHDYAALLKARSIKLLLISPSGRAGSPADDSRALWSRPRFDLLAYAQTFGEAARLHWAAYAYLKQLSRVRAATSTGIALIHDVTVEGGPVEFNDPDTDAPVVVGIYAMSVAEEFVA